jgi:uncharacterized protein YcbK (DUF882 family)
MLSLIGALVAIFFLYCNSLSNVNPLTISYYNQLKKALGNQGYQNRLIVISSKRVPWHNQLLTLFGASSKSRHLTGDAIDIMVWDVNDDGEIDSNDVDIVYNTLDEKILKNTGGLGTYKTESGIWNTQMVHLDCRQKRTRWNR